MRVIQYLSKKDLPPRQAGATIALTLGLFGWVFVGLWLVMPDLWG